MTQVVSDHGATASTGAGGPFEALAERLPQLVWTASSDGAWEFVNGRWEELVGSSRASALGLGWRDFLHPEELERWPARSVAPSPGTSTVRFRGPAGTVALSVRVDRAPGERWIGIGTLVDEHASARSGAVSESVARRVLDLLYAFVSVLDVDGTVLDINDAPVETVGATRESVIGRKFWEGPWGDFNVRAREACERAARGEHVRYDDTLRAKDGRILHLDLQFAPLRDEHGRVTHIVPSAIDITARKEAENALRESEELARRAAEAARRERQLLDAVLEAAPVGILVADASGRIVRANPAADELLGAAPSARSSEPGWPWKGWWADHGERHGQMLRDDEWAMASALRGECPPRQVVEIEPSDAPGERKTILTSAAPVREQTGRVIGAVVAQMDITDRVRAEESVRRSDERYRLVARATNDAVWDWDILSGRLEWSESALDHFGCTSREIGDRIEGWDERIHPDDRERVRAKIYAAIDGDAESWSDEYRFRRSDGTYRVFLDRGFIARDESGRAHRMIGSMLDVTEQRRAEAALRESENRFRTLADNLSQLVWVTDAAGNLRWANQRWVEYVGVRAGDLGGRSFEVLVHPDHSARVVDKLRRHLESGTVWEDTFPMRRHDGGYRWFLARANPIRNEAGEITRWFGTNTDVTAQRETEELLRQADRHKDEFLAMLAHELRNPLAPVRNAAHMLKMIGPRDPTLDRLHEVIERQVTHMARLIDDLLDVSRVARGRIQLRRERHDLVQIVKQTVDDYRESLEGVGIVLTFEIERSPLSVDGDGTRLAQIVGNLLHNSGKFTERGGCVSVRVGFDPGNGEHPRGWATVTVSDTGVGMEPALIGRLFQPFTQEAQGIDRSKGGLGLGLALAKALVELHGGTISARSAGLGRGSTFVVRLPLAEPVTVRARAPEESGAARRGLRILIVEDNQDAAETLQMLLELAGHEVYVAFDGRAGIDAARQRHPDVVVCDIGLPGSVDGYQVARALRAAPESPTMLIALSGYSQPEDRRRSREAGFDAHLAKPADFDTLRSLLATVPRRVEA